ncbi:MAG TPA: hypothetical protein VHO70_22190 [Chitinispirillaceae bacterium]|nr:hypothetical protein [Chitinispirillaceae bacterium]
MADTLKANILFLLAVFLLSICSCNQFVPDNKFEVKQITESAPATAESVSGVEESVPAEADIGADQALMQWENCITRNYLQKPSMFSIISYIRSNVSRPEIFNILIKRFLSDSKNGVLSFSRADLYQIASGVPFRIRTPSEPATGKSYFTDSSVVLILKPDVDEKGFYMGSMWRYPLQDWCSRLSDTTPSVSIERTSNTIEATYSKPVPITFFSDTGIVSAEIKTIIWTSQVNGYLKVLTINQAFVHPQKLMCMIISKAPVSTDSVSVSWQSWCSWSIDIDKDSIADLRTIASGDTLNDKGKFDIFAQVNIDGNWVTTDYKIDCEVNAWQDYNEIKRGYTHKEWDVWDSYSMETSIY